MSAPGRRLKPSAHPAPLVLGAPALTPDQLSHDLTPDIQAPTPVVTPLEPVAPVPTPPGMEEAPEHDGPEGVMLSDDGHVDVSAAVTSIIITLNQVVDAIDTLTAAVRTIGEQQQYTTDTIGGMYKQFSGMIGSGNPLKMIAGMLGGKGTT